MKPHLTLPIAIASALALAACGKQETPPPAAEPVAVETPAETPPAEPMPAASENPTVGGAAMDASKDIVTTASAAPNLSTLDAAVKAAVNHLSRCVANELGGWNVRVNSICPGAILTPIFTKDKHLSAEEAKEAMRQVEEGLSHYQPIPRAGLPEDVARAALWLASDDSSFVTGINLVVDGGATCGERWSDMMAQQGKM